MDEKSYAIAVEEIEKFCNQNGYNFTEPRRHVLDIVFNSDEPIGAYDILDKLKEKLDNPKPPTVYRAIEFFSTHGFIHRIESLNAYVACHVGHRHNGSQFMICQKCGTVQETHLCSIPDSLKDAAKKQGFQVEKWNLELHGVCQACLAE